jgi:SAM-dependent methyltransferase
MTKTVPSLKAIWRRVVRLGRRKGIKYHYEKIQKENEDDGGETLLSSSDDVISICDLRPSDVVLDMGCAEGLVSMELAKYVRRIEGVEIVGHRVEEARRIAAARGITNISFSQGSVIDCTLQPLSYDVTLFLAVLDKVIGTGSAVGLRELEKLLAATRRQIIIRYNVQKSPSERSIPLQSLLDTMDASGFDALCFGRHTMGNLIVGNRRGTDVRCRMVPPFVLVPAASMRDHPCIRDAKIGSYDSFA